MPKAKFTPQDSFYTQVLEDAWFPALLICSFVWPSIILAASPNSERAGLSIATPPITAIGPTLPAGTEKWASWFLAIR